MEKIEVDNPDIIPADHPYEKRQVFQLMRLVVRFFRIHDMPSDHHPISHDLLLPSGPFNEVRPSESIKTTLPVIASTVGWARKYSPTWRVNPGASRSSLAMLKTRSVTLFAA
jgi:hypothetical protein